MDQVRELPETGMDLYPALKWSVYIAMACTVIAALFYPFHRAATATASPDLLSHVISNLVLIAAIVKLLVMVFAFIVFLRWLFFTVVYSETLGFEGLRFSPAASVTWFLIPVVNIPASLFVMLNVGRSSFAANGWDTRRITLLTVGWWFAFLFWLMSDKDPARLFPEVGDIDYIPALTTPVVVDYLAFFIAAILFLLMIRNINRAQMAQIRTL